MTTRSFGAVRTAEGTRFRLWAPNAGEVRLVLDGRDQPLRDAGNGWREAMVPDVAPGTPYQYQVGDLLVPDPASRAQADDVHGPSLVVDPDAYAWQHTDWKGRPWAEAVIEEVHVGTATPEGTFDALRRKLSHYAELGVTAIELLPVSDFAGTRNWGYDGVLPYAPDTAYGTPDDLRHLIDEAHGLGLMVYLDVVYNHFGPEGNYLGAYASDFFDPDTHTPWGAALNFSAPPVRDYFVQNAIMWLTEYRFDGLRFDAVQAITDMAEAEGQSHFLEEMAQAIRAATPNRHVHLILENDDNAARLLMREGGEGGEATLYDCQWNDDFHHVVHRLITGEADGYYVDYDEPATRLARVLAEGFAYQGEPSPHRDGAARGEPSGDLPPEAFCSFIQNHDQVGNRAMGDRIDQAAICEEAVVAATALYLLCPHVPMIWMGEEWAASSTFPFFCDFHGELADAVREGRRREFARFDKFKDPEMREMIPDPNDEDTYLSAKLDWQEVGRGAHARRLALFRELIAARHEHVVPLLKAGPLSGEAEAEGAGGVQARWEGEGGALDLRVNLSGEAVDLGSVPDGRLVFATDGAEGGTLPPWSIAVRRV